MSMEALYMTIMNPRPADALRAALKAAGFNARRVSVRADNSLLRVTIRDASASLTKVKAIAAPFESVRHCQATGEILAGGNIFLACEYADALVAPVKATILAVLDPAPNDEYVALSGGYHAMKCTRQSGQGASYVWEVQMKGPGFTWSNEIAVGVGWAAERIAVAYLDASALAIEAAQGSAAVATV